MAKKQRKNKSLLILLLKKKGTYPTDGKLAIRMINHLHKIAKKENLRLRRTYVREIKEHRINLRFFRHPKRSKKARSSTKRLRTIVGILIKDISKNLENNKLSIYQEKFDLFDRVRKQQIKDKNKILSIHEQHVYSIAKGKDHKKYEYGVKASVVTTKKSGIIVGVTFHEENWPGYNISCKEYLKYSDIIKNMKGQKHERK